MDKQEKVLLTLFTLFFVTLYFSAINSVNLFITGIIVVYSFSFSSVREKLSLIKKDKFIQGALIFFALLIVSGLLSENLAKGLHYLKLRVPLLIFPISIGLLRLRAEFKHKVFMSFALTTIAVCIACLFFGIYNYTSKHQLDALYNDNFTSLLGQQSVYIALLINFAVFILGYHLIYKKSSYRPLLSLGLLFLVLVAYLLGSRINLGVLVLVAVGFGFYYLISNRKVLETATLCLALVLGSMVIYKVQPQMLNRFKELAYNKYEYDHMGAESHYGVKLTEDQWNGANLRLAAWSCGWELFEENLVIGVGLGDKKDALFEKYEQKNFRFAIETNKNVHNNYLDVLYSLGIIGFILFIAVWILIPFVYAIQRKDWLAVALFFTLGCAWMTEIYFDRSLGGMVTGFFIPFKLTKQRQ